MRRYYEDIPEQNWQNARVMRREPTEAERVLWSHLERKQTGVRFRRQHPIGRYIADFVCLECSLVIELDGATHATAEAKQRDSERTEFFENRGFRVIRFWNNDVVCKTDSVVQAIKRELAR